MENVSSYIKERTSENASYKAKWKFEWMTFLSYFVPWIVSFLIFFGMLCVMTIIVRNDVDKWLFYTFANNETLSLILSLIFSVLMGMFWDNKAVASLAVPQKIIQVATCVAVLVLFVCYVAFEVLINVSPDNVFLTFQNEFNIAFLITTLLLTLADFLLLSIRQER